MDSGSTAARYAASHPPQTLHEKICFEKVLTTSWPARCLVIWCIPLVEHMTAPRGNPLKSTADSAAAKLALYGALYGASFNTYINVHHEIMSSVGITIVVMPRVEFLNRQMAA